MEAGKSSQRRTRTKTRTEAQKGSGALPDQTIDSVAVSLTHASLSAQKLAERLRAAQTPIIGRLKDERLLLDMHGADPLDELVDVLCSVDLGSA